MRHVFRGQPTVRSVSYEYSNRDQVWEALTDFIFFVIPLFSWKKLKNKFDRIVFMKAGRAASTAQVNKRCPVCSSLPNNPTVSSCEHVYCYYCLMERVMEDSSAPCLLCDSTLSEGCEPAPIVDLGWRISFEWLKHNEDILCFYIWPLLKESENQIRMSTRFWSCPLHQYSTLFGGIIVAYSQSGHWLE